MASIAVLAFVCTTQLRAQLVVDPLEVQLTAVRPVAVITIRNESGSPQQATLSIGDWDRTDSGQNRFFPVATQKGSCGATISAFPLALRVEPHDIQTVRIGLTSVAPTAECWSVVFIAQAAPQAPRSRFGISYAFRTGVKVYALPARSSHEGEIDSIVVRQDSTKPERKNLLVGFRNIGSSHETAHGSVEIRRPDNSVAAKLDIAGFPTLPGAHRTLTLALPSLSPGRYVALAVLDFGGQEVAAGELEFDSN